MSNFPMTPKALRSWRHMMGFTQKQASNALGLSRGRYVRLENLTTGGANLRIALACAAIFHEIAPWTNEINPYHRKSTHQQLSSGPARNS